MLKLDYLLRVSRIIPDHRVAVLEAFIHNCIHLTKIALQYNRTAANDAGVLAAMALVKLEKPGRTTAYTFQAAFLVSRLISDQLEKEGRPLIPLTICLHMKLGLGSIAVGLYPYLRAKEFLQDTVSHVLFTRFSSIYPQHQAGNRTADPQELLQNAISTYKSSKERLHSFHGLRLQNFEYDQALEIQELKESLDNSVVRHMCILERRRMIRLRGQVPRTDELYNFGMSSGFMFHFFDFLNIWNLPSAPLI